MRAWVAALGLLAGGCATVSADRADLLLTGGSIYTGPGERAEAVAIRGNRILAVGSDDELTRFAGDGTRTIDLEGRLVIPGINDAHIHAPWPQSSERSLAVEAADPSREAFLVALERAVSGSEDGAVVAQLPLPLVDARITRSDLDAISSTRPIRLTVFGGHSAILNSAALAAWGISEDAEDPPGGWYGRENGRLNGWLYEHAYWIPQFRRANTISDAGIDALLDEFESETIALGITSVQTMSLIEAERLQRILDRRPGRLRWRVIDFRMAPYRPAEGPHAIKYVLDGTPIERSIALREPYTDAQGLVGTMNYSVDELDRMMRDAADGERQLLLHAVGDRTIEAILSAMERIDAPWPDRRVRIEHGDLLSPDLAERARKLGVVIVQNPAHFMIPESMIARLGAERTAWMQPAASLLENGVPFAIGSDGPLNPYLNIFFATLHPTNADEGLSIDESLTAYTSGSAYAEFMERDKGRIAPGMLADLAVLSQDIFAVPPPELPKTTSVMTIVDGRVVQGGH